MVSPSITTRLDEEWQATYAPAGVAIGLVLTVVGLTAWIPLALAGGLIALAAAASWVAEAVRENRGMGNPIDAREPADGSFAERVSLYWWGAAGFAFTAAMMYLAASRVLHAHGLFAPEGWPAEIGSLNPPAVAALALLHVAALGTGVWAARESYTGTPGRTVAALLVTIALGVAASLAIALDLWLRAEAGVGATTSGPASAWYWVHGVHVALLLGGVNAFAVLAGRASSGALDRVRWGPVHAVATYWTVIMLAWLVLTLIVHLRVLTIRFQLI